METVHVKSDSLNTYKTYLRFIRIVLTKIKSFDPIKIYNGVRQRNRTYTNAKCT